MREGITVASSVPTAPAKPLGARGGRQEGPDSSFAVHLRGREIGTANEQPGKPAAEEAWDQAGEPSKHRLHVPLQRHLTGLAKSRQMLSEGHPAPKFSSDLELSDAIDDRKQIEAAGSRVIAAARRPANAKDDAREKVHSRRNDHSTGDQCQMRAVVPYEPSAGGEADSEVESTLSSGVQASLIPLNVRSFEYDLQIGSLRQSAISDSDGAAEILEQLKAPIVSAALQMEEGPLGNDVRTLHLILRPGALGEVEISLRRTGKTLSVTIETEMAGTGDMLRRDSPVLEQLISSAASLDTTIAISDDRKAEAANQPGQSGGLSDRDTAGGGFSRRDGRPPFPHKDNLPSQARDVTAPTEIAPPLRLHPAGILLL